MEIENLLVNLMNKVGKGKHGASTGDLARYYAILLTEIEKIYAFYLLYLYPTEADIPQIEETE